MTRRHPMRVTELVLVVVVGLGAPVPAAAQTAWYRRPATSGSPASEARAKEQANALLAEGNALFTRGRHVAALDFFQRAYAAYPSPKLHYSIGQAYYALGRPLDALREYELFLRDVPKETMATEWTLTKNRVVELQQKVSAIVVQSNITD